MRRAVAFLTVFGGARQPSPTAVAWFPTVGAALGAALGGLWWAADRAWPPAVAAALVVGADLAVTGLLHFDGLVDAADGLLPPLPRQQRLQVMRDPGAGAFGVSVAVVALLARWVAFATLRPSALLVGAVWALARGSMAVVPSMVPYARVDGGLASGFFAGTAGAHGRRRWPSPVLAAGGSAAVLGLAGTLGWRLGPGAVVLAVELSAAGGVVLLARRRLGGYTGDVLGAAGVVAETAALVVAAARW